MASPDRAAMALPVRASITDTDSAFRNEGPADSNMVVLHADDHGRGTDLRHLGDHSGQNILCRDTCSRSLLTLRQEHPLVVDHLVEVDLIRCDDGGLVQLTHDLISIILVHQNGGTGILEIEIMSREIGHRPDLGVTAQRDRQWNHRRTSRVQ